MYQGFFNAQPSSSVRLDYIYLLPHMFHHRTSGRLR
jgi:hypothetical protein